MSNNHEGQAVPQVIFRTRREHEWVNLTTDEIFQDKTIVVFSLPGAFTPTCSSTHVPRYNQLAPVFKQHGVDEIICISVNDAFVMNEWQREQHADNLTFLPDGNGHFRMLVKNGIVEKMFVEPDLPGDPFEVSDADTMLAHIAPHAAKPRDVTVFTREGCEFCVRAKGMLLDAGMQFEELVLNRDYSEASLRAVAGKSTVPQVFIDGAYIGGSEDLESYLAKAIAA
jgi:glutaredoxin-like protein